MASRDALDRVQRINVTYSHDCGHILIQYTLRTNTLIRTLSRAFLLCRVCQGTTAERLHHRTMDAEVPEWRLPVQTGSTTTTRPGSRAVVVLNVYYSRPHLVAEPAYVGELC